MVALNYKEKNTIKIGTAEDPLWFEWFLTSGIFRYKIVRIIFLLNIIFSISKYAVQLYYFKNNHTYFIRYGLLFFGEPYAIVAGVVILWKREVVEQSFDVYPFWTHDSCGENFKRKIEKDIRKYSITVYCVLISICIATCVIFYPTPNDKYFLFPVFLIEQHWPEQAWFLSLAYKLTLVPLGYSAMVHPLVIMYGTQHTQYQTEMLAEHLNGILTGSENEDEDHLYCDKEFQDGVYKRIAFCVKRQIEEINFGLRIITIVRELFSVFVLFGYLVGIAIIMIFFTFKLGYIEYSLDNLLFPTILCLNATVLATGLIISGQQTEESMTIIRDAVMEWKWWALDVRNQKMMLLILSGTKDYKMQVSETLVVNYDFGVRVSLYQYSYGVSEKNHNRRRLAVRGSEA